MRLADYLDDLSWSQKDLARQARISPTSVSRALRGEKVSRRVANSMVAAISRELKQTIRLPQVEGLRVAGLRRRKVAGTIEQGATPAALSRAESSAKQTKQA